MQHLVHTLLKILKEHVDQNNREIELNQEDIRRIMKGMADKKADNDIVYKQELNKELNQENEDFTRLHVHLSEFFEQYGHLIPDQAMLDEDDITGDEATQEGLPYFKETISGQLQFDAGHPQFKNNQFFDELIRFYQERENYEQCDRLLKVRNSS